MAELDSLFLGAFLGSVFSFASGYLLHYAVEARRRRNDLTKSAESIIHELEDIQSTVYKKMSEDTSGQLLQFSISSIDSVIYSGLLREFDSKTQVVLVKLHGDVATVNVLLREALDYYRHYESEEAKAKLHDYQKKKAREISDKLPSLIEQLKPYIR